VSLGAKGTHRQPDLRCSSRFLEFSFLLILPHTLDVGGIVDVEALVVEKLESHADGGDDDGGGRARDDPERAYRVTSMPSDV
jgi:hypothetical protein